MSHSTLSPSLTGLPTDPTLDRFLDFWLAHIAWPRLRFTTARTYAGTVARIIDPVLGTMKVCDLKSADVVKAGLVWQRAGVKQSMRRKAIEVLRSAMNHAVALGLCDSNPASRVKTPPKPQRTPVWLDVDEARSLLDSAKGHSLETAYMLAICIGLRRGEINGLTWNDVDFQRRVIHVRWNRTEWHNGTRLVEPKTTAARRVIAMPKMLERSLRMRRRREQEKARKAGTIVRPADPVLTTRSRRPYWTSYLYVELKRRLERLGMPPMRFHDLRHTAASLMLAHGAPPRTVMEIMGHRNLDVTMFIYGHTNIRHQREAARIVDNALSGQGS
jgi:integrase